MRSVSALFLIVLAFPQASSLPVDKEVSIDADASVDNDPDQVDVAPTDEAPADEAPTDEASTDEAPANNGDFAPPDEPPADGTPGLTQIALMGAENQDQADDTIQYNVVSNLEVNQSLFHEDGEGETGGIKPETGEKIPVFAQTFPGCSCTYDDSGRKWFCKGSIAMPQSVAGNPCCCCTLACHNKNRCTNQQCLAVGIDQAAEIAAEEKRMAELLQGADLLLGEALPGFVVTLPKGACTLHTLVKACEDGNGKESGLTPLCDHSSYVSSKKCYAPKEPQLSGKHFSHYSSHRQVMKLEVDDEIFYGMCFATTNANSALYPTGNSHGWATGGSISARPGTSTPKKPVPVAQMNAASGELGGWRTICVKNAPGLR